MCLQPWKQIFPAALAGIALIGSTASAAQFVQGQGWDVPRSGRVVVRPPGYPVAPPGHSQQRQFPGNPGFSGDQGWIGVPGLDAGYDRWRRNAEQTYRQGGFYIQGWQHQPYPYLLPPRAVPQPRPWPR